MLQRLVHWHPTKPTFRLLDWILIFQEKWVNFLGQLVYGSQIHWSPSWVVGIIVQGKPWQHSGEWGKIHSQFPSLSPFMNCRRIDACSNRSASIETMASITLSQTPPWWEGWLHSHSSMPGKPSVSSISWPLNPLATSMHIRTAFSIQTHVSPVQ